MLQFLANFKKYFGPFRLFESHAFMILLSLYLSFFLSFIGIKKFSKYLPKDRGRSYAEQSANAVGKPTGAGIIFIIVFVIVSFLVAPMTLELALIVILVLLTMLSGYLDDISKKPWNEYKKGIIDLILSLLAVLILSHFSETTIWIPFTKDLIYIPKIWYIIGGTLLIWISINSTNCSDGVDGLSGALVTICLVTLGLFLYLILGHIKISSYLLLKHIPEGAKWAIVDFAMVGSLLAYLWFNAYPSQVLMGDAGSRALGFFMGVLVLKTGNPFLYLMVSTVLLANGGTGLVKVAFLRFLKIKIFHNTKFPLHDHVRSAKNWSNTQVLVKFVIIQMLITLGFLGLILKIR